MEIKPDTPSPDHQAMEPFWTKVTDIVDGQPAIIDANILYLPQFPDESDPDYAFRLSNAKFTNVYRDVVENLANRPFAKETAVGEKTTAKIVDLVDDIDGRSNHLHVFAADTFFAGINKAIDWILIEHTKAEGLQTVEDEKQAGVRPYWVHIPADKVIWIESAIIEGREQLTKVKILELKNRVREYERTVSEKPADGEKPADVVMSRIWVRDDPEEGGTGGEWKIEQGSESQITIGVIPMVPFITGRRKGKTWQFLPPMSDAADLQINLYRNETNLEHYKTMTCFPMLAGNGVTPPMGTDGKPTRLSVGPNKVLYAPPTSPDGNHGEWLWISTDAQSLRFLASDIKEIIREIRELGRQPLTASSGNLTVITTAVAAQKGNSAVQQWALALKDALENAFVITAMWLGIPTEKTEVQVHTDFGIDEMDSKSPEQLIKLREGDSQNGPGLSLETLWDELKRRGLLSAEFDPKAERDRLFKEIPGGDLPEENEV